MKNNSIHEPQSSGIAPAVVCNDWFGLLASAKEQRGFAAQCIHAPKAKSDFIRTAETMENAHRLCAAAHALNEVVEGVRSERWASDGRRLKDTPEWCAFYCALPNIEGQTGPT